MSVIFAFILLPTKLSYYGGIRFTGGANDPNQICIYVIFKVDIFTHPLLKMLACQTRQLSEGISEVELSSLFKYQNQFEVSKLFSKNLK